MEISICPDKIQKEVFKKEKISLIDSSLAILEGLMGLNHFDTLSIGSSSIIEKGYIKFLIGTLGKMRKKNIYSATLLNYLMGSFNK